MGRKSTIIKITTIGLLVALEIILTRYLSIQTPILRISFGFIPIALVAMKYGWLSAGLAAVMADLIGVWLGPFPFFPGFTLTAFLAGCVYGIFLHKNPGKLLNIIIAAAIVTIVLNLGLDTIWLMIIQEVPFTQLFWVRIWRTAVMLPLQIVCILILSRVAKYTKLI
ncbi:MAG: folate family ECF transporter S component [Clostridiales bacterium]|jgi:ECF transporter S component (folate family)|nr:folate family ECF transporter S component [Clostridiales bacterium]